MICRTPVDLCWTFQKQQLHQGAPKIHLRCLQLRFWAASFSACICIVKASYFRCNFMTLKNLLHAFMHDHSCSQPPQPFMLRTKGPSERITFPTCSQTTDPFQLLPSFLLILGKKMDGASAVQDFHAYTCMHSYIVCKIHGYLKLNLLWWLTCMVGQVGAICWVKFTC